MLYTVCVCLFVLFAMIGISAVCYCILLILKKPKRKNKSVIIIPMDGGGKENARRIAYAAERINLFGEDENIIIAALKNDGLDCDEAEEIFGEYRCTEFVYPEELPEMMKKIFEYC